MSTADVLTFSHVHVSYGPCRVLEDVSITLTPGRVRALVGENGAGKSTLMRVIAGLAPYQSGEVRVGNERPIASGDVQAAVRAGVAVVHQHFMLVETANVARNVVLGAEPRMGPLGLFFDAKAAHTRVKELSEKHGLQIDPDARVESLTVGERQRVELLRVLYRGARYMLLDEPTAVLSPREVDALLDTVRTLARDGAAVLLVTHKLREVFAVADDITVLRHGRVVLDCLRDETDAAKIADGVMGVAVQTTSHTTDTSVKETSVLTDVPGLELRAVRAAGLSPVTLCVKPGEVVGIAGVEGSGQRTLLRAIAGLVPVESGEILVRGRNVTGLAVHALRALGVGFVPEDREGSGLFYELSIEENLALGKPSLAAGGFLLTRSAMRDAARAAIETYDIRPADPRARVGELSGGNAQKVLVARELSRTLDVLLIAQPTRGVDILAARHLHAALEEAVRRGMAVLMVSSELDELRALSDRVIVMRQGTVVGDCAAEEATDAWLGPRMVGGT